ncbi:MAG: hypothetical protein V2A64_01665 [Candidatus Omnitrophota bacterium]
MVKRFWKLYLRQWFFLILGVFILFACAEKEEANALGQIEQTQIEEDQQSPQIQPEESGPLISSGAEALPNPFLTREEEAFLKDTGKRIPIENIMLSAVLYSQVEKSKAVINGRILKVGDLIENKQVIEIQPEAVVLKDTQGEYIVNLKNILE